MFPSIMAPKIPILVSQCEMDHEKPTILLIFSTLSLGGCGGHPMRPKLNLKNKGQISKPNEYTDNFKPNSTCIFLSVRAKLKKKHFALGHGVLCKATLLREVTLTAAHLGSILNFPSTELVSAGKHTERKKHIDREKYISLQEVSRIKERIL